MKIKAFLFLSCITALFFYKTIFFGLRIFYYDMSLMLYPYMEYASAALKQGLLPGWNPYLFCGFPILAANQSGVFYPVYLILRFLFDTPDMYSVSVIIHFFIMIFSAFLLIREYKLSGLVSAFGAISFGFSGFMTVHHFNIGIISARSWIPLLLLFFLKFKKTNNIKYAVCAGIILFFQLLTGHPQPSFNAIVFIFLYFTISHFFDSKKISQTLKKTFIFIFFTGFIGIGLSSFQIFPTFEFSKTVERTQGDRYGFMVMRSMPPYNILNLFYPEYAGNPCENSYVGAEGYDEFTIYFGIISLCLSFIAVIYLWKTNINIRILSILAFLALLFGLGGYTPVFKILYYIPGFKLFRAPSRFLLFFELFMCILASFGFDYILKNNYIKSKFLKILVLFFILFFLMFSLSANIFGDKIKFEFNKLISGEYQSNAKNNNNYNLLSKISVNPKRVDAGYFTGKFNRLIEGYKTSGILFFAVYSAAFIILFFPFNLFIKKYLILTLLIFELFVFFQKNVPLTEKKYFTKIPETVRYLKNKNNGFYRIYSWNRGLMYYDLKKSEGLNNGLSEYERLLNYIPEDQASLYRMFGFWGYDTMISRRLAKYRTGILKNNFNLLKIAGIKYIITDSEIKDLKTEKKFDGKLFILEIENPAPQFYFVNSISLKNENDAFDSISADTFDYTKCAVIELDKTYAQQNGINQINSLLNPAKINFSETVENVKIKKVRRRSDYTTLEIENPNKNPVLLVFNDSYYPEWRCDLNGKNTDLFIANYLFKSVVIPYGTNSVRFYYSYDSFKKGIFISAFVLILTVIVSLLFRRRVLLQNTYNNKINF